MNEKYKSAALERGAKKAAKTLQKIEDAIRAIAADMASNGGIYSNNGGTVSMAEIARRACINESTLYKKGNVALKRVASNWLESLNEQPTVGRARTRQTQQEQLKAWQSKYAALEIRHIRTELQLQQAQADLESLQNDHKLLIDQLRNRP